MRIELDLDNNEILALGNLVGIAYVHRDEAISWRRMLRLLAKIHKAVYESPDNPGRRIYED